MADKIKTAMLIELAYLIIAVEAVKDDPFAQYKEDMKDRRKYISHSDLLYLEKLTEYMNGLIDDPESS